MGPTGILSSSVFEYAGPVGPAETVLPGDEEKGLFPIVPIARPMGEGIQLNGADRCVEWDIRDEFETINGMPVYYGGDLCDSDESDWEDLYDIACAEYVEQYNFDTLEGMELMVFKQLKGLDESDVAPDESVMMVRERTDLTHVRQTSPSYPRRELDSVDTEPVVDIFDEIAHLTMGDFG